MILWNVSATGDIVFEVYNCIYIFSEVTFGDGQPRSVSNQKVNYSINVFSSTYHVSPSAYFQIFGHPGHPFMELVCHLTGDYCQAQHLTA